MKISLMFMFYDLDGVAPRAKMNQQRARRFRSAQEAREADEKKEEFRKMLAKQNGKKADEDIQEQVIQKTWDSNVITPGTPFMDILAASLRYWIAYKLNTDPAWEKVSLSFAYGISNTDLYSSKLSSPTRLFRVKENTKLWSLSGRSERRQNTIPTPAMSSMDWMPI